MTSISLYIWVMLIMCSVQQEQISLLSKKNEISFTKINEHNLDLSTFKTNIQYLLGKSLISIKVIATSDIDSSKSQTQPIRVYSKLNALPAPESSFYDKKDDDPHFNSNTNEYIYSFDYTPCEITINDVINIIIVGIEGTSKYTLNIDMVNSNEYKIICTNNTLNVKNDITIQSGYVESMKGVIAFGGKYKTAGAVSNDMYILHSNAMWERVKYNNTNDVIQPRYGMGMSTVDNGGLVVVFGGKGKGDEFINDLWVYEVDDNLWYRIIDIANTAPVINYPKNTFQPSTYYSSNHGVVIIFGGQYSNTLQTASTISSTQEQEQFIYVIDISILKQLLHLIKNDKNINEPPYKKRYNDLLSELFTKYQINELKYRILSQMVQISTNELLIFGGLDNNYPINTCDIINIDTFSYVMKVNAPSMPSPRSYHTMKQYGNCVFLYGGVDSNGEELKDMWKFISSTKTWIEINHDNVFLSKTNPIQYFKKSSIMLVNNYLEQILKNNERPIVIQTYQNDKQDYINTNNNEILILNIPICQSDSQIQSDALCLPCAKGFELSNGQCDKCYPGKYLSFDYSSNNDNNNYSKSKCLPCPAGTYNTFYGQQSKSACLPCPYGTYNNAKGQIKCNECGYGEICLIASTNPISFNYFNNYDDHISTSNIEMYNYLNVDNMPEFIDQNSKMKYLSLTAGLITVGVLTTLVIIIIAVCLKLKRKNTISFLLWVDFLPLTGGSEKKSNGGVITIVYSILICSLAISFILRYLFWNDIVEITTIDDNTNKIDEKTIKSSIIIEIDVYGENIPCQLETSINNYTECSPLITFTKNNNETFFTSNKAKVFQCKYDIPNRICNIKYSCENCNDFFTSGDKLSFEINDKNVYVSLYKWTFKNYWSDYLYDESYMKNDDNIGHSILNGIFKANEDIQNSQSVFKGNQIHSSISLLLSPIFYTIKDTNEHFSGHRVSLNSYERGTVRNEYSFNNEGSNGVGLDFVFTYSQSRNIVTVKKDLSLLDFFAFILGMLAGFSFLSRVSKFIFEKCGWLDYNDKMYEEFKEEINKDDINNNNKQNIEMQCQQSKQISE